MSRFLLWFPMLALALLCACSSRSAEAGPQPESSATVQVENQAFSDMVIYVINGTERVRLGLATGNSTKSFTVPNYLVRGAGTLRFLADPVGSSRAPISEEITVRPGDIVTLTIPPS